MNRQDTTALPPPTNASTLLEQAGIKWQFGDWQSLANIQSDTLQHHPDRAKLALLAAAGRLQTNAPGEAKQFIRLAQDWGISKKLISQILIAGVHNSLGRAAAIGNQPQCAQQHFENAITIGTPGSDAKLLTQARMGEQLSQLGLPTPEGYLKVGSVKTPPPAKLQPLSQSIEMLSQELKKQNTELSEKISKQNTELTKLRKQLESTVKKEMLNATQQLEAFLNIQSFFTHGEHQPIMHGWPISPDFALYLIGLLEKNDYDLILEFGSGTSTVIMAKALARLQRQNQSKPAVVQIAFEHLEQYHTQTLANLQSAGMAGTVEVVLAPLQPYKAPNDNTYPYYACQEKLTELANSKQAPYRKILVVVDGPPGSTGKHARYPAFSIVLNHFKNSQIDFVLDDYFRDDEKEVGTLWTKDCEITGLKVKTETIKMEKDAFFISVHPN